MKLYIEFDTDTATEKDYKSLLALTNGLTGQPATVVAPAAEETPEEAVAKAPPEEPKPKKKAKKPEPEPVEEDPNEGPEPDDEEPQQTALERATELLSQGKQDAVKAALEELGAGRVRELDAADEAKFIKLVEGE